MKQITFARVKELTEQLTGCPVNVDLLWGVAPIIVRYPKEEKAYFRKFRHIAQRRSRFQHNINDVGNRVTVNDLYKLICHFQKVKLIELGSYEVIP